MSDFYKSAHYQNIDFGGPVAAYTEESVVAHYSAAAIEILIIQTPQTLLRDKRDRRHPAVLFQGLLQGAALLPSA